MSFTANYGDALQMAEFAFIAVNTPSGPAGETDTTFVSQAAEAVLTSAATGSTIVVKSTVPPGTAASLADLARLRGRPDVYVVSNPEFLRQSTAVHDFFHPDRIIIGSDSREQAERVAKLYEHLHSPVYFCGTRSAELAKYAANGLLATRLSFMNEIASLSEAVGADIEEVQNAVCLDPRIGSGYLRAGLGWGGSCLPKDLLGLIRLQTANGCEPAITAAVYEVNARQRQSAFTRLRNSLHEIDEPVVAVLGLAFKPGTDDVRGSPAIEVIARLMEDGVHVRAHDPLAEANARAVIPNVPFCEDPYDAVSQADALFVATEWPDYLALKWDTVRARMRGDLVFDGRNCLDAGLLRSLGFRYLCFGRATAPVTLPQEALPLARQHRNGHRRAGVEVGRT